MSKHAPAEIGLFAPEIIWPAVLQSFKSSIHVAWSATR